MTKEEIVIHLKKTASFYPAIGPACLQAATLIEQQAKEIETAEQMLNGFSKQITEIAHALLATEYVVHDEQGSPVTCPPNLVQCAHRLVNERAKLRFALSEKAKEIEELKRNQRTISEQIEQQIIDQTYWNE
jgi:ribonucleotide reductase alpha subunit